MNSGGLKQFSAISLVLLLIAIVGGGLMSYLGATNAQQQNTQALMQRAATIATALSSSEIATLKGQPSDADLPAYHELQTKLRLLKQSNTDARSIYLASIKRGEVYFIADSEAPNTAYYMAPGTVYRNASIVFKSVFAGTTPTVEGPLSDASGGWVSGLAPVVDLRTGQAVAIVGIDVDAAEYNQVAAQAAVPPLLVALLFVIGVIIYEWNRQRLQRELQLRSELMSIASHELRTPITGMRWAAESMLHIQPDGPTKTMAQAMYDSVLNLQAGTEDILQLTRLQKNPKLQLAPTDLLPLINEICATQRILAGQKRVVIKLDGAWPTTLMLNCDPARMKQVFHNIVSNAVKYALPGTVVSLQYGLSGKKYKIAITDQGIGIPKDEQSRVFAGFYRASNAKASGETGTGLGLYLVKTIVEQHHGAITFTSQENKGTTFVITLPAEKQPLATV